LKFKADFHSKISVYRHEIEVQPLLTPPPAIRTLRVREQNKAWHHFQVRISLMMYATQS